MERLDVKVLRINELSTNGFIDCKAYEIRNMVSGSTNESAVNKFYVDEKALLASKLTGTIDDLRLSTNITKNINSPFSHCPWLMLRS